MKHPESHRLKILWDSLILYGCVAIFDPTNTIFHLKTIAFAICMFTWFIIKKNRINNSYIGVIILCWLFLTYGFFISTINCGPVDTAYQIQISNLYFLTLLVLPLSEFSIEKVKILTFDIGIFLSIIIIIIYLIYLYSGFGEAIYIYFNQMADNTIIIARRDTLGIEMFMFFHKGMPFLLLPMAYAICKYKGLKRIVFVLLFLTPMIIGGSRTPILCSLAFIGLSFFIKTKSLNLKIFIISVIGALFIILLFTIVSEAKASQEIKFDSYSVYLESITRNVKNFLFGQGIGGMVKIPTRGFKAFNELSFLDLFNQYGVIIGILFGCFILYPGISLIFRNQIESKLFGYAYLLYMVIAATNPLLFSSTGWFVWALTYVIAHKSRPVYKFENK